MSVAGSGRCRRTGSRRATQGRCLAGVSGRSVPAGLAPPGRRCEIVASVVNERSGRISRQLEVGQRSPHEQRKAGVEILREYDLCPCRYVVEYWAVLGLRNRQTFEWIDRVSKCELICRAGLVCSQDVHHKPFGDPHRLPKLRERSNQAENRRDVAFGDENRGDSDAGWRTVRSEGRPYGDRCC